MSKGKLNSTMRVYHRYLGFFLTGIMGIYAISGILMIFRTTDFLKIEKQIVRDLPPNTSSEELGKILKMRDFKVLEENDQLITFKQGQYEKATGKATYVTKELPVVLSKLEQMHKATVDRPLFFLNIFFGLSLLFFVLSSFWMFMPATTIFRKGIYFTIAGFILALIMVLL